MKSVNRAFNEKFFKHIHSFEELLRDMKFNKIRMLNRRAVGIKEDIKVKDLIRPSIICGHKGDIEENTRINEKILLDYYYQAYEHHIRLYSVSDIITNIYPDCEATKRFLGRLKYYVRIMKEISAIIDIAEGS
jgi:hypothetical protein|nr:MAG TPA: hypothetical protein [Bacteriophage sp.]